MRFQAHGIVDRPSRDIDVATNSSIPMEILASRLIEGLTERDWQVHVIGIEPVSARFLVADPELGQDCEVDILKEGFTWPPIDTPYGPVLSFDDVIGTKVRALADRGYARDLVDIHAASRLRSHGEMESLGRLLAWDEFSLEGSCGAAEFRPVARRRRVRRLRSHRGGDHGPQEMGSGLGRRHQPAHLPGYGRRGRIAL
jgi:Nucleotidyl transferase AbiEii toxin, Type IV TA system